MVKNPAFLQFIKPRKRYDPPFYSLKMTIQRNWQHRLHKTNKNKPKTQHNICWTPLYEINVRENRRANQEWTLQRHKKHWVHNTQDEINVRENRRANQEWTLQRHKKHWVHNTQDEINAIKINGILLLYFTIVLYYSIHPYSGCVV